MRFVRRANITKPALNTLDHHIPDYLAGDPGRGRHPADDLSVLAVQGKGDTDDIAVPAGELQCI
jgi:hypothetical protein